MGTNYYLYEQPPCECCGRGYEPKHIGKSSGGWCFSLHVIPDEGINDLVDWEKFWTADGAVIKDEYDTVVTADEMRVIITDRSWPESNWTLEQYRQNQGEPGPNNLVRHKVDGRHCVKHGAGTWDCITGEFS